MIHELADDHKEHLRTLGVAHIPDQLDIPDDEYEEHAAVWRRTLPDADDEFIHKKVLGHHASKQHSRVFDGIPPTHLADSKTIEDAKNKEIMAARADVWKMSEVHFPALKKELDDIEEAVEAGNGEIREARTEIGAAIAAAAGTIVGALNMNQSGIEKIAEDIRLDRAEDRQLFKRFGWGILTLLFLLIVATLFAPRAHGQFSHINSIQWQQSGSNISGGFFAYPFTVNCSTNVTCSVSGATLSIASSGGAATGYQTIKNAAVAIAQETTLNWLSGSIGCVDNAGTAASDCSLTVPGSGTEIQYRSGANTLGAVTSSSVSGANVTLGGLLSIPVGSFGAPSLTFTGHTTSGFWWGNNNVAIVASGADVFTTQSTGIQLAAAGVYQWSSSGGATAMAPDTGISRCGVAIVCFGNGLANDFSGTIKATTINAVTGFQVNGSSLNFSNLAGTASVSQGGTGISSGTSGGIPYYSGTSSIASSAALTANLPVIGGGAGVAPSVGTRSGNTTAFVTTTGTQTSGDCVKIDANGNHVANGSACGGGAGTVTSIATTSPITGGTITTTGTIACATCVTSAASLTSNALVLGAGSQATATAASLGTTTTVLHGNAAGAPSFAAVSLTADVSGTLPVANGGTGNTSPAYKVYTPVTTPVTNADAGTGAVDMMTYTLAANELDTNDILRITMTGTLTSSGGPNPTFAVLFGGTTIGSALWGSSVQTNKEWKIVIELIPSATFGATVACEVQGGLWVFSTGNSANSMANTATINLATNSSNIIKLQTTFNSVVASNSITQRQMFIERLRAQ